MFKTDPITGFTSICGRACVPDADSATVGEAWYVEGFMMLKENAYVMFALKVLPTPTVKIKYPPALVQLAVLPKTLVARLCTE